VSVMESAAKSNFFIAGRLYTFYTTAGTFTGVFVCPRGPDGILIAEHGPASLPKTILLCHVVAFDEFPSPGSPVEVVDGPSNSGNVR